MDDDYHENEDDNDGDDDDDDDDDDDYDGGSDIEGSRRRIIGLSCAAIVSTTTRFDLICTTTMAVTMMTIWQL